MDNQEPPRKKKKSDKEKKKSKAEKVHLSKESHAHPPLPPEPCYHAPPPPTPDIYEGSEDVSSLLPSHSDDSELDLSSLMADHVVESSHVSAVEDCVLPTVPSLADMLCQSDICSSIASAGSSLDDADSNSHGPLNRESNHNNSPQNLSNIQICDEPVPNSTADIKDPGAVPPLQSVTECDSEIKSVNHMHADMPLDSVNISVTPQQEPSVSVENLEAPVVPTSAPSREPIMAEPTEASATSHIPVDDLAELQAHAHQLLDSASSTGVESEGTPANEQPTKENSDGYRLMSRYVVQDVIPKHNYEELPEGWKELAHCSGLPVYCHLKSRVVTWSRPYFLGDRFAKSHDVPASTIPCLIYRRCKELQRKGCPAAKGSDGEVQTSAIQSNGDSSAGSQLKASASQQLNHESMDTSPKPTPAADVPVTDGAAGEPSGDTKENAEPTSASTTGALGSKIPDLTTEQLIDYCKSVFIFQTKEYKKFENWQVRKQHEKAQRQQTAITNTDKNVIMIPVSELPEKYQRDDKGRLKRDFYTIAGTHTAIDILTSYVMWVYRKLPYFESAVCPEGFSFSFRIKGSDTIYSTAVGQTKKLAKEACSQNALRALIPKYSDKILDSTLTYGNKEKTDGALEDYYKVFDGMSITDQRVWEVAKDTNQIYPLSMLKACICRNYAMSDKEVNVDTRLERKGRNTKIVCDMVVGQFSVKNVFGKNTKIATHIAAQDILQQMHPHLTSWGSILRLYGKFSEGSYVNQKHESDDLLSELMGPVDSPSAWQEMEDGVEAMQPTTSTNWTFSLLIPGDVTEPVTVRRSASQLNNQSATSRSESGYAESPGPVEVAVPEAKVECVEKLGIAEARAAEVKRVCTENMATEVTRNVATPVGEVERKCREGASDFETPLNVEYEDLPLLQLIKRERDIQESTASVAKRIKLEAFDPRSIEVEVQTDVGGVNAFYSHKSLKPSVVLEEGVTVYENYSSEHGSYLLLANTSVQTVTVGHSTFHKATQMPEMSYNPYTNKNVVKAAATVKYKSEPVTPSVLEATARVDEEAASRSVLSMATQTEPTGVSRLHKATQQPDKEYLDPGHPPPPAPPVFWPDQQQLLLLQQQQQQLLLQQQLALQQQHAQQQALQYMLLDQNTGLPLINPQPHQYIPEQMQQYVTTEPQQQHYVAEHQQHSQYFGEQQQQQQWLPYMQQQYPSYEQ